MKKPKKKAAPDFEKLAAEQRAKREEDCRVEINAALKKYRCKTLIIVQVGSDQALLSHVLNFPASIQISSE